MYLYGYINSLAERLAYSCAHMRGASAYFCAAGGSGCPGACVLAGSMYAQGRALRVQMLAVIFMPPESSSEPARTTSVSSAVERWL